MYVFEEDIDSWGNDEELLEQSHVQAEPSMNVWDFACFLHKRPRLSEIIFVSHSLGDSKMEAKILSQDVN